ncbi:hypothetical protein CDEST_02241 [Colletotrichum destructivum]|uniref:Uncharacterized protein n=1 Tax=Colletotrichum destructivum TaxID=34406 RepID=A0AAX4I1J6_9PEZI|nr:hypothetical protein CDEST_02241 [Colletotrichum destructivum]
MVSPQDRLVQGEWGGSAWSGTCTGFAPTNSPPCRQNSLGTSVWPKAPVSPTSAVNTEAPIPIVDSHISTSHSPYFPHHTNPLDKTRDSVPDTTDLCSLHRAPPSPFFSPSALGSCSVTRLLAPLLEDPSRQKRAANHPSERVLHLDRLTRSALVDKSYLSIY